MALSPEQMAALWAKAERDSELRKAEQARREIEREAAIVAAREKMEALWDDAGRDAGGDLGSALARQGHILNELLRQTVATYAGPKLSPSALDLILRAQRECRQTAQALARLREQNRRLGRGGRGPGGTGLDAKFPGKRTDSSDGRS